MSKPDQDKPLTHHPGSNIARKLCTCAKCGKTSRCLPGNDFYVINTKGGEPDDPAGKPLVCEPCFRAYSEAYLTALRQLREEYKRYQARTGIKIRPRDFKSLHVYGWAYDSVTDSVKEAPDWPPKNMILN